MRLTSISTKQKLLSVLQAWKQGKEQPVSNFGRGCQKQSSSSRTWTPHKSLRELTNVSEFYSYSYSFFSFFFNWGLKIELHSQAFLSHFLLWDSLSLLMMILVQGIPFSLKGQLPGSGADTVNEVSADSIL